MHIIFRIREEMQSTLMCHAVSMNIDEHLITDSEFSESVFTKAVALPFTA